MKSKNEKISESMLGNTNAEKWTEAEATDLFIKALAISNRKITYTIGNNTVQGYEFDYLGEIARELNSYIEIFDYLVEKFPHLKALKDNIKRNCEANCFSNSKKGIIKEATAIVNLKANHGWTDRQQTEIIGGITLKFDSDDAKA